MTLKEVLEYKFIEINDYTLTVSKLLTVIAILVTARLLVFALSQLLKRAGSKSNILDRGKQFAIVQLFKYFVYVIALILALQNIGLDISVLVASSAALFVGIGLGLQNIFTDIISGIFLLFERTIEVGDLIEVDGLIGRVKEINIRTSKVRTRDDIMIIIPNSAFINGNVINWSTENKTTRFILKVGVAYGSDTRLVEQILLKTADEHKMLKKSPKPFVRFYDFGNSSLDFELLFWTDKTWEVERIKSDLRFAIDAAFREAKVTIPFPQRDLHLKSVDVSLPLRHIEKGK